MSFIVYKIKNKITEKVYIGYTKHLLEKRWKEHCRESKKNVNTPFYNAIKKYGTDCWDKEILIECLSSEEAKKKEIELILEFNSYNDGYNATLGGDGNNGIKMSEESNMKRSIALKGIPKNYLRMHGKKHSLETIEKMKKPKKNKLNYRTEEFKNLMRQKQAKAASERRSLTKEQYDEINKLVIEGISKKQISIMLSVSYDLVKKWSCRKW